MQINDVICRCTFVRVLFRTAAPTAGVRYTVNEEREGRREARFILCLLVFHVRSLAAFNRCAHPTSHVKLGVKVTEIVGTAGWGKRKGRAGSRCQATAQVAEQQEQQLIEVEYEIKRYYGV